MAITAVLRGRDSWLLVAAVAVAVLLILTHGAQACGRDDDCMLGDRSYRIALPGDQVSTDPIAAVIFVHGYRGKSANVMKNATLTAAVTSLGAAFVAVQAAGPEWSIPGVPSVDAGQGIDELAYFDALTDDLVKRFNVDQKRILVAGFSSGAMMVWHLACYRGSAFLGFVPMSGTFWQPLPQTCPTNSVNLIHYHGEDDTMVPLHGRPIKDGHQGDVYKAIEMFSRAGNYHAAEAEERPELECSNRVNDDGKLLELCLFPGKHELRPQHIVRAWREFQPAMDR